MAKGAWAAAAVVAARMVMPGQLASAEPVPAGTVVLHVTDYERVPRPELVEAQDDVTSFYARIGVRLVWADGSALLAAADGALHLDVSILSNEMTEKKRPNAGSFGDASRATRRAYIYHSRIASHAIRTGGSVAKVLALVLAHEAGHMLLPEQSHAPSGLMRANWGGRLNEIPDFMPGQAETIRTLVAAGR
jgi:hypothetical protein